MNIMLITKITPNISLQSKPDLKPSRLGFLAQQRQTANALIAMPYYRPSFGSLKIPSVGKVLESRGVRLAKRYLVKADETIHVLIDDAHTLGKEPIFCWDYSDEVKTINPVFAKNHGIDPEYKAKWAGDMLSMEKEGNTYTACPDYSDSSNEIYYAIYYQDTKKWDDNGGKGYVIKARELLKKARSFDKAALNQPLLRIICSGSAKGKIVCCSTLSEFLRNLPKSDEPLVAVVEDFCPRGRKDGFYHIPSKVKGVLLTKTTEGSLGHSAAALRGQVDAAAMLYDDKEIEALQKMEGKFISLDVNNRGLKWHPIKETEIEAPKTVRPAIQIPEIRTTYKLLTSAEYTPGVVGPKAYNSRRLEEMKQKGGLKDVEIPRSFAIPCGVFDKIMAANPEKAAEITKRIDEISKMSDQKEINDALEMLRCEYISGPDYLAFPESVQQEIMDFSKKVGLQNMVKVRSAFNGEDAKGYSAAGLYDSSFSNLDNFEQFLRDVRFVLASKWNYRAYMSRIGHNIAHDAIKPTVLVQDYVYSDYRFTIYTKDPENVGGNKMFIQMYPDTPIDAEPYVIKYDRATQQVEVETIARKGRKITLDEDMNVVDAEPINDPILNNMDKWRVKLKKVCDAALEVEKEFGAPQDIEGGIKFGADGEIDTSQIYFWQTREQII